jgi:putative ABC transport system ATP-binding protein
MKSINRDFGVTFIFSTHDKKVMSKADRLIRIEDGTIRRLAVRDEGKWIMVRERRKSAPQADAVPAQGGAPL